MTGKKDDRRVLGAVSCRAFRVAIVGALLHPALGRAAWEGFSPTSARATRCALLARLVSIPFPDLVE